MKDKDTSTFLDSKGNGSLDESINYVKKLIRIGISSLAHLRMGLHGENFVRRSFEGQEVFILDKKSNNEDAIKLEKWMKGIFEALDKKYVKA